MFEEERGGRDMDANVDVGAGGVGTVGWAVEEPESAEVRPAGFVGGVVSVC